ncbi:uncharacterized protein [Atheta coriaria]|uniref:uncharacterized protein n=1 Tax=Dalotia coriaria TaxID=877792 RepID=UPI0031F3C7A9
MWTSNLIFMLTWLSSIVGCKTNFLYANITGSGENVTVKATCVCDDYNDAIAWITPPQTEFLELLSANKTLRYVNFDWANKIWFVQPAYRGLFGPVLDYTWENMPIFLTRATTPGEQYEYKEIRDIQILNQLELNFSFLGKSNAHIYLCSGVLNNANSCLVFILGSGNGNRSHIKLCKYNATKTCENLIEEIIHDHFFSENNWSQITIRYLNQQLQVIVNNKRLISLNSMNWNYTIEFQKYTKVSIHSNTENALWKYHEYSYYEDRRIHLAERSSTSLMFHVKSTYLCISFFANFQKEITIQLYDHSERLIETEKYSCKHSTQWNYKTFNTPVHENHEYFIVLQSSYGDIIAIRDMVIHDDCNTMDRFNHHISSLSFSLASIKNIKCSSLRHRSKHLTIHPADNKSHCKICSAKYHNTIQNSHRIICNEQLCYCSNGYIGNYCEKQCEDGRYGCNCVCKCGECVEGLCNPVNGECNLGCKNNYIEPYCIERNLPVITGIASIQSDCVTNCTIRIYDKELKYDGAQEPQYYYTRLIHPNNTVTERQITPVKVNVINFTNLIKDTKYNYQIVLCVGEKKSTCFKQELTIFQFETTCDELHNYQIIIKNIEKETNIYVENYQPVRNCFIQNYQMLILDEAGNTVQSATHLEVNNTESSLKIFTNYTLRLIRNNKITNNIMFTTDESKPLGVNDVKITSALASAFKIVWKEPLPVQGIITQYLVEWKFCGENDCLIENEEHEMQSRNVTAAAIELNDLSPCSVYEISIYAFTKKGRSEVVKTTAYTDVINLDPYNYTVSSTATSVQISFNVDCINMKNPSLVIVNVTCKSDWCKGKVNKTSKQLTYKNDSVIVENLLPYTNYLLDIYLQFNQQISLNNFKIIGSQDFITLSSVPHKIPFADVYSLSETSLSIRWSAPYPPTGKLDTFIIQYGYNTEKETTFQNVTVLTSFCIIWPELFCLTLTDLKYNKTYTISITAQNQGIPYNASETVLSETTLVKVPQPPQHQIAFWSSTRFLQLEWKHPNKTNGPLLGFAISINGEKFFHKGLENLTYTYQTQFRCEPDNYQPTVTIQTVNSLFSSELLSDQFICPILQPSFSSLAFVKQINCHNFTVLLPTIENTETISFLYIVVLTSELDHTGDCRDSINSIHDSLISSKENQTCWIVEHYEQHEYKEIEDTELNINIPEMAEFNCTEELYEVGVLIVNELGDQISSNWYQLELIEMSSLEVTELSLVTISLLVVFSSLLVIIIIVGPMCRYTLGMSHTNNRNVVYSEIPVLLSSSHYITSEVIPPPLPMKKTKSAANINEKCSRLVALADLHEYVRDLAEGDDFIAQHKKIVKLTPVNNEYQNKLENDREFKEIYALR